MPSKWVCIILNLIVYVVASVEDEKTRAFIKLTEFAYEDACMSTAEAEWEFINSPSNEILSKWVCFSNYKHRIHNSTNMQIIRQICKIINTIIFLQEDELISYASFKNLQKDEVGNISKADIRDESLQYKYDVAEKIGDALLDTEDFKSVRFHFT